MLIALIGTREPNAEQTRVANEVVDYANRFGHTICTGFSLKRIRKRGVDMLELYIGLWFLFSIIGLVAFAGLVYVTYLNYEGRF